MSEAKPQLYCPSCHADDPTQHDKACPARRTLPWKSAAPTVSAQPWIEDSQRMRRANAIVTLPEPQTRPTSPFAFTPYDHVLPELSGLGYILCGRCPASNVATFDDWRKPAWKQPKRSQATDAATAAWWHKQRDALIASFPRTLTRNGSEGRKVFDALAEQAYGAVLRGRWGVALDADWRVAAAEKREALGLALDRIDQDLPRMTFADFWHFVNWWRQRAVWAVRAHHRVGAKSSDAMTQANHWGTPLGKLARIADSATLVRLSDDSAAARHLGLKDTRPKIRLNHETFDCPVCSATREISFSKRVCSSCGVAVPAGHRVRISDTSAASIQKRWREAGGRATTFPLSRRAGDTPKFHCAGRLTDEAPPEDRARLAERFRVLKREASRQYPKSAIPDAILADPDSYTSVPRYAGRTKLIGVDEWLTNYHIGLLAWCLDIQPVAQVGKEDVIHVDVEAHDAGTAASLSPTHRADTMNRLFRDEPPSAPCGMSRLDRNMEALLRIAPVFASTRDKSRQALARAKATYPSYRLRPVGSMNLATKARLATAKKIASKLGRSLGLPVVGPAWPVTDDARAAWAAYWKVADELSKQGRAFVKHCRWLAKHDKGFPVPPPVPETDPQLPDIIAGKQQIRIYAWPDNSTVSRWGRIQRRFAG